MSDPTGDDEYDLAPEPPRRPPPARRTPTPATPAAQPASTRQPSRAAPASRSPPRRTPAAAQTLDEQAARISWFAPGILGLLTLFSGAANRDQTTAAIVLGLQALILLIGFVACGYVWVRYLRKRNPDLPRGAVLGLVLNILLAVLVPIGIVAAWNIAAQDAPAVTSAAGA